MCYDTILNWETSHNAKYLLFLEEYLREVYAKEIEKKLNKENDIIEEKIIEDLPILEYW